MAKLRIIANAFALSSLLVYLYSLQKGVYNMIISAICLFAALIVAWFLLPASPSLSDITADSSMASAVQAGSHDIHI